MRNLHDLLPIYKNLLFSAVLGKLVQLVLLLNLHLCFGILSAYSFSPSHQYHLLSLLYLVVLKNSQNIEIESVSQFSHSVADPPNPNYSLHLSLHLFSTSVFTSSFPAWVDRADPSMWNSLLYRLNSSKPVIFICLIFNHFRRWIITGSCAWIHHKSLLLHFCWVSRLNWISFYLCLIIATSYSP